MPPRKAREGCGMRVKLCLHLKGNMTTPPQTPAAVVLMAYLWCYRASHVYSVPQLVIIHRDSVNEFFPVKNKLPCYNGVVVLPTTPLLKPIIIFCDC